jgi:hypothetical protein
MQDVEELLAKEGLDRGQPFTGSEQHLDGMLPLAIFDDTEYESRDAQGWVCKEPGAPAAPGRVAMPSDDGSYTFQDCTVLDYHEQKNTYLVQLMVPGYGSGSATILSHYCCKLYQILVVNVINACSILCIMADAAQLDIACLAYAEGCDV